MQKTNIAFGAVFTLVGALFLLLSFRYGIASPTSDGVPGAGFFPLIVSSVVVLLGVILMLLSAFHSDARPSPFRMDGEERENLLPFCLTIAGLLAFFALWHVVPFQWAALLFCLFLNRVYRRSWRFSIIFSIVFVFTVYYLFNHLLYVQFEI